MRRVFSLISISIHDNSGKAARKQQQRHKEQKEQNEAMLKSPPHSRTREVHKHLPILFSSHSSASSTSSSSTDYQSDDSSNPSPTPSPNLSPSSGTRSSNLDDNFLRRAISYSRYAKTPILLPPPLPCPSPILFAFPHQLTSLAETCTHTRQTNSCQATHPQTTPPQPHHQHPQRPPTASSCTHTRSPRSRWRGNPRLRPRYARRGPRAPARLSDTIPRRASSTMSGSWSWGPPGEGWEWWWWMRRWMRR